MRNNQHTLKFIRKFSIISLAMLLIIVVAGLVYTWYMGQNVELSSFADPVDQTSSTNNSLAVVKPAENVPESAAIQSFTTPVLPGSNASIVVRTKPDSTCKISVIYDKTPSDDSGLVDKTSDEYGMVSWSWSVGAQAPVGIWPARVDCYYGEHNEQWAVVIGDLEVVSQLD